MSGNAVRVGILGGTFSPIHHGHVICAQEARIQLELDSVRLMPVGSPPHRDLDTDEDPGDAHRLSMVKLAVIGQPGLEVSTAELDREGTSYTVDTLAQLVDQEPDTQFTLIIGADQAMSFGNWREPEKIAELADIAVATRVDNNRDEAIAEVIRATGGKEPLPFSMPRIDISSTFIRDRVYRGETVAHLVPAGIPELIEEAQLYR
ncbi:MAG: nicotinate (nicotinamide) nucleotide adenylyltransferase [Thermoleophilaceae bacterium]|nr:nicotinate (nicotinamide) nucleotide adenylyltransferase [Thermoleophilaceae bacterium]